MKVSELNNIANMLKKFATVREKADGPETRIGVQVNGGRMKFIASDGVNGIVVDVMEADGSFGYFIPARTLFQGIKVLPPKSEVTLVAQQSGLDIVAAAGGKMTIKAAGPLTSAGFATPPKGVDRAYIHLSGAQAQQIAKLFPAVTAGKEKLEETYGSFDIVGETAYISFVEPRLHSKYACIKVPGTNESDAVASSSFMSALSVFEGDCFMSLRDGIHATDHKGIRLYGTLDNQEHWPVFGVDGRRESFTTERKKLMEIIKGQVPNEERGRVVISWEDKQLEVRPFGSEGGQSIPVETSGSGIRGVDGHLLLDMLNAMTSKSITVSIVAGSPAVILSGEGYEDWTLMLAPLSTVI